MAAWAHRWINRREFVLGCSCTAVMMGLGGLALIDDKPVLRPPGGQNENHLLSACIRCQKCYEVCPRNVIAPSRIEDGIVSMRTPTLDFSMDYCDWCQEENSGTPLCAKVCPTRALDLPAEARALTIILGKAAIKKDWCLAYRLTGCRFCFDACPYEAMYLDENQIPHVLADVCNGCGACECVCVSLKSGSITVGATARAIAVFPVDEDGNTLLPSYYDSAWQT